MPRSKAQNNNGTLDDVAEFSTKTTLSIPMPGGVTLSTDVYLPITSDSFVISTVLGADTLSIELIPKGTQLIIYPYIIDNNGDSIVNPNPYQLPLVFSRTPYNKSSDNVGGVVFPFLGYAYAVQDMRGRYDAEGVYLPMYSDGWQKAPYHQHNHSLDISLPNDSFNGRWHQDGLTSLEYLLHQWTKDFDLNNDGIIDTTARVCNGSVGMFGASALGNSQYQLAAASAIDTTAKGLKCLLPIVATNEHYNCTGYNNGVYRTMLTSGWITGQLMDIQDSIGTDNDLLNNLHTPFDFGFSNKQDVIDIGIHHLTTAQLGNSALATAYPNSIARLELDASRASVNLLGEGDPQGLFSRYSNMNVPAYHLTGWYDIFINGQIDTWQRMRSSISGSNQKLQKLVIGPWAHQTIASKKSGDITYPDNVESILGLPIDSIDLNNLQVDQLFNNELLAWYRYNLNQRGYVRLGDPIVRIPESQTWQSSAGINFRVPAADYDISIPQMANYLGGLTGLPQVPVEIDLGTGSTNTLLIDVPLFVGPTPFSLGDTVRMPQIPDFKNQVADVRFYVMGPIDSTTNQTNTGNYWYNSDSFPLSPQEVSFNNFYLHQDGSLDHQPPVVDEGSLTYEHDPDQPVLTIGGANMLVRTPQDDRYAQGQMNYADTNFASYTMYHPGVLRFESAPLNDTLSIIGFPKATLYVSSTPQTSANGLTDTDFFVRILDVYPDGRIYNVVEGAVNARAREYARSIYQGQENDSATFSNINIGQIYELQLEMLPVAYTFGNNHTIKVLISSSNFPRYQSNPNIPIEDGEFFRRNPNDGQVYTFQNQTYTARKADNSLYFSTLHPSRIELPIYQSSGTTAIKTPAINDNNSLYSIAPNPANEQTLLLCPTSSTYQLQIFDAKGQQIIAEVFEGQEQSINLKQIPAGIYYVQIKDLNQTDQMISHLKLIKT